MFGLTLSLHRLCLRKIVEVGINCYGKQTKKVTRREHRVYLFVLTDYEK